MLLSAQNSHVREGVIQVGTIWLKSNSSHVKLDNLISYTPPPTDFLVRTWNVFSVKENPAPSHTRVYPATGIRVISAHIF